MGIRGQLALLVPGLVGLGLIGLTFLASEQRRREETADMRERSTRMLEAVGVTAAVHVAQNDMAGLDTLIAHVSADGRTPDLRELMVVDGEGRILAHSTPERFNLVSDDSFVRLAVRAEGPVWEREKRRLRVGVPALSGLRWATVVATFSLDRLDATVARGRNQWLLTGLGLAMLIGLGLFVGLDRLVVRPLRELRQVARQMGEGRLDVRAPPVGGLELRELGSAFDRMASALKAERENLERAVAERTRELQAANERLEKLAVTDGLTGAYNHRRFQELLAQEALRSHRTQRPLSVLMIDVDHFKRFNDTHGHPAGDALLRRLVAVLLAGLRTTDVLSRYGGEEFAVLLPETDKEEAAVVAERLRAAVEKEIEGPGETAVSVSIGVATLAPEAGDGAGLVEAADRALYTAKERGRNRVVTSGLETS